MRFCPYCGMQLSDDVRFCIRCGTDVTAISPQIPPAPPKMYPQIARLGSGYATTGLVTGIIAICIHWMSLFSFIGFIFWICTIILSILAITFGFYGWSKTRLGRALAGGVLGIVSLILGNIFFFLNLLLR